MSTSSDEKSDMETTLPSIKETLVSIDRKRADVESHDNASGMSFAQTSVPPLAPKSQTAHDMAAAASLVNGSQPAPLINTLWPVRIPLSSMASTSHGCSMHNSIAEIDDRDGIMPQRSLI
ncbi:hypothetical protein S40293_11556 [Stachybotrys chartarum IBT 40293]|nr:hypothetical protein S40293_11556 [Stachybotrys chartarum IBT 40293]